MYDGIFIFDVSWYLDLSLEPVLSLDLSLDLVLSRDLDPSLDRVLFDVLRLHKCNTFSYCLRIHVRSLM